MRFIGKIGIWNVGCYEIEMNGFEAFKDCLLGFSIFELFEFEIMILFGRNIECWECFKFENLADSEEKEFSLWKNIFMILLKKLGEKNIF